jgi:hypothetical protein
MKESEEKFIHAPKAIPPSEWQEILQMQTVRDTLEIPPKEPEENILPHCYGAKFALVDADRGVIADLYVIQSDTLRLLPVVLVKYHGMLPVGRDE